MALRERNSALHWAATRPEDNTPAVAVAVGHFVQVGMATEMASLQGWPEERFSVVRRRVGKVHPVSRIGPPPCAVRCFALHRGIATARKLSSHSSSLSR